MADAAAAARASCPLATAHGLGEHDAALADVSVALPPKQSVPTLRKTLQVGSGPVRTGAERRAGETSRQCACKGDVKREELSSSRIIRI